MADLISAKYEVQIIFMILRRNDQESPDLKRGKDVRSDKEFIENTWKIKKDMAWEDLGDIKWVKTPPDSTNYGKPFWTLTIVTL